jgi:hypothetical protein
MAKKWDEGTETLRGIAILLMTAGHVIGDTGSAGMQVADDSAWRHFYVSLQFLRMPLFTVISGYVYAIRPVEAGVAGTFLRRKLRRLLIPMVTVGTAFFLLRMLLPTHHPGQLSDIWRIYLYPYAHFWYLQALLLVFVVVVPLERLGALESLAGWALCTAGAAAVLQPAEPGLHHLAVAVHGEQQRHVHRYAGEDRFFDRRDAGFGARDFDEQIRTLGARVQPRRLGSAQARHQPRLDRSRPWGLGEDQDRGVPGGHHAHEAP